MAKAVARTEDRLAPLLPVGPYVPHQDPDDEPWEPDGLTVKQRRFVEYFLSDAGGNATKAAELAGYNCENRNSLAVTAWENLRKPKIKEAIARSLARAALTPEWVREMAAALAASNMGNFLDLDDNGEPRLNWRQAERIGAFVQIRKYKEKTMPVGGTVEVIERQVETHNPAPFMRLLCQMLGLVSEGGAANVSVNVYQMSDDDLMRIARSGRLGDDQASACPQLPDGLRQGG